MIIILRASAVTFLQMGKVVFAEKELRLFSFHGFVLFLNPSPLPSILGNENSLFYDGSPVSLVTDLLGEFLLSLVENARRICGSHMWVGGWEGELTLILLRNRTITTWSGTE